MELGGLEMIKKEKEEVRNHSPLLERYLQKTMTNPVENIDDLLIAKAIKTLLAEDKGKNKHLN